MARADISENGLQWYTNHATIHEPLSPEEDKTTSEIAVLGAEPQRSQAREKLVLSNLRLVLFIADKYSSMGLPKLDLIQEGNLALIRSLDRFKLGRAKFASYAGIRIRAGMLRAISNHARLIRMSVHRYSALFQLRRKELVLLMKLDREPTLPELAEATGLTIPKIQALYREKALEAGLVHLDEKVTPNSEMTWAESIPDLQAPSPSKQIEQESLKILINSALGELTARDRQILEMLYGAKPAKLREVGKSLDVSKQFIQIQQDKLLSKLKKKLSSKLAQPNQELSLATQFL